MSENKDFLSQFSDENKKPESFKEEQLIPIQKEKKEIKPALIFIPLLALLLFGILAYFLFFRPKIEMPNFVGTNKSEIASFVKQQEIDPTGIVFKDEYNLEYDADIVIYQSVEAGKKIGKKEKMNFTISLGADPDEKISLPDINNMNKTELDEWLKKNKLQKTKITTAFSDNVPEGEVISYDLKGDEDAFTRGTTLNITVSKGPAPVGSLAVEDFRNKTRYDVETWAKNKKVSVNFIDTYSDDVASASIISQIPAGGTTMKEGDILTVYVSKGKGVRVPDFANMTTEQINSWAQKNNIVVDQERKVYSSRTESILYQSVSAGSMVAAGEYISIIKNAGQYFYVNDEINEGGIIGMHYDRLVDTLNNLRTTKGIDAFADDWTSSNEVYSEKPRGTILSVICRGNGNASTYDCGGQLPLDARFDVTISRGRKATVPNNKTVYELVGSLNKTEFVQFAIDEGIALEDYDKQASIWILNGEELQGDYVDVLEDMIYVIKLK